MTVINQLPGTELLLTTLTYEPWYTLDLPKNARLSFLVEDHENSYAHGGHAT